MQYRWVYQGLAAQKCLKVAFAAKIIGPHDTGIADAITANLKPVPFAILQSDLASSPLYTNITDDMRSSYFENLRSLKSFMYVLPYHAIM